MKNKNSILRVIKFMLKTAKEEKPLLFFTYFIDLVVEILRKIQIIVVPKFLIDELVAIYNGNGIEVHLKNAIIFASVVICIQFVAGVLNGLSNRLRSLCEEYFDEYFQVKVNDFAMTIDYQLTEDPEALNQLNKAKEGMSWYSGNVCGILNQFFSIVTNVIVFCGVIVLVCTKAPLIIPIGAVSLGITAFFSHKIRQIELKSFEGLSKSNRIFGYIFYELSDFMFGKDIRLYNSANLFSKKAEKHLGDQIEIWKKQAEGSKKQEYGINIVDACSNFLTYFYIGFMALKGILTIGDFSMCISASSSLTNCCRNVVNAIQEILKRSKYAEEYLKFLEYPQALEKGFKPVDTNKDHEIEALKKQIEELKASRGGFLGLFGKN